MSFAKEMEELGQINIFELEERFGKNNKLANEDSKTQKVFKKYIKACDEEESKLTSRSNDRGFIEPKYTVSRTR